MQPTESTFRRYKVDEDARGGCVTIGRQVQWGDKNAFFVISGHKTSERSELRLKLQYGDMDKFIGFPVSVKRLTLNDLYTPF